MLEVHK